MRRSRGVGTPLDQTGGVELVDEARHGDGSEIEDARELALACAFATLQPAQHRPLGAGRRQLARALVGQGAQQPRNIMQGEREFAGGAKRHEKLGFVIICLHILWPPNNRKPAKTPSRRCERSTRSALKRAILAN